MGRLPEHEHKNPGSQITKIAFQVSRKGSNPRNPQSTHPINIQKSTPPPTSGYWSRKKNYKI